MPPPKRKPRYRHPVTTPGYNKGRVPGNKGKTIPAEVLTPDELERLVAAVPVHTRTGARNMAMFVLMYRVGLKIGTIIALERRHYEAGSYVLTVPARNGPDQVVRLDSVTRKALNDWLDVRRALRISKTAPLFTTLMDGTRGNRVGQASLRDSLHELADKVGIEKNVTPSGLKKTYEVALAERTSRIVAHMAAYIDEPTFGTRYPVPYENWRAALDLFEADPERNAARIGIDCRGAAIAFVNALADLYAVELPPGSSPVAREHIRSVLKASGTRSARVDTYLDALVSYWGAVVGLVQQQVHAAEAGTPPTQDDARRALFQTLLVMHEIDSTLREEDKT